MKICRLNLRNVAMIAFLAGNMMFSGCRKDEGSVTLADPYHDFRNMDKVVTVGYSGSHTISNYQWFKFIGTGESVIFDAIGENIRTELRDEHGDRLNSDCPNWWDESRVTIDGVLGKTYYIGISSHSSSGYTFSVKATFNNDRINPITVVVGNSSSHTISCNGEHWFMFVGDGKRVFFETEGKTEDPNRVYTTMEIYKGDNSSPIYDGLFSSYNDNYCAKLSFMTVLGTIYYIRITGNSGIYTFDVHHGSGDGSSPYNAKEITKGNYTFIYTYYMGLTRNWFMYQGTGDRNF